MTRAGAAGLYEGRLRDLVHALKYGRRVSLARPLARLMRERGASVLEGADLVVPVPLHWQRRRERGFNQAVLLARHLGCPLVEALARARPTPPQASLRLAKRHANVRDAFVPARPLWRGRDWARHAVAGRVVVIVDDVCTTGATLDACARVLVRLGAADVRALTAARVALGPPPPPPG
ncbi:MAG: ComF family protein [Acidobacteria bacterium]|nr:ComF family protein [Acidobacteriota bacterium]